MERNRWILTVISNSIIRKSYVIYVGEYKNGKKVGIWDFCLLEIR